MAAGHVSMKYGTGSTDANDNDNLLLVHTVVASSAARRQLFGQEETEEQPQEHVRSPGESHEEQLQESAPPQIGASQQDIPTTTHTGNKAETEAMGQASSQPAKKAKHE